MQSKRHNVLPILNIDTNNWYVQDMNSIYRDVIVPDLVCNEFETLQQAEQFLEDFIYEV